MTKDALMQKIRQNVIGDRNFYRKVFTIVIPIIIQNTITNVVSLLDNIMVGRIGTLEMSAVAIVNQLLFVFMLCIFGGLAGAGIFSTQYAGAGDDKGIRHCFRFKYFIGAGMLFLALAVFLIFPRQLISLYLAEGTTPEAAELTLRHSLNYLFIMLVGLIPFVITQVYDSTLRELGETRLPMISGIAAILVNLVFNYFLIFGTFGFPKLGVIGAAIATVLSRFVEAAIIVIFTHCHKHRFGFIVGAYKSFYVPGKLVKDIIRRGTPLLLNEGMWASGMAMLLQCYSVRGLDVIAAMNINSTIANLFNAAFLSMGNAAGILVGQTLGANKPKEAKQTSWRVMFFSLAVCAVMSTVMIIFAPMIPKIYNTEETVRHMATQFLYVNSALMGVYSCGHCCYFTMRSGGNTFITFLFDSVFTWVITAPIAFALCSFTGLPVALVYLLVQSTEIIKSVIGIILVQKGFWIHNIVSDKM